MEQKKLADFTDAELIEESKKTRLSPIVNALFVGFLVGIIAVSVFTNTIGLFTLIPVIFTYGLIKQSKRNKELEALLKKRKLG